MLGYDNDAMQLDFTPRDMVVFLQDYTLIHSTISFCHGFRIGQKMAPVSMPMKISNLPSAKYKLKVPVDIILERHSDEVLALLPELTLCGEGVNDVEAIDDLKADILDLLDDLENTPKSALGPNPILWKQSLELMVEKCQ